ncbi:MAG: hypothetical protein GY715_10845 [Planctomycetes bacterium]|nr:hypothetical protein [Planctomycetota bacterium]
MSDFVLRCVSLFRCAGFRCRLAPLAALVLTTGCAGPPKVDAPAPLESPRWTPVPDLAAKAAMHETSTFAMVDENGLLTYTAYLPWGDAPAGDTSDPVALENYRFSHELPDAPAWQGYLMAALGFKAAAMRRADPHASVSDVDADLRRLAGALHRFYVVTGEPGLLGNTMVPGYTGAEPLFWMAPDAHKPWVRSETTGEWWRDGVNKGHLNLAMFGCAIPLALERRGELELTAQTRAALRDAMVPAVARLVRDRYRIHDRRGRTTQHGDLGPDALILPNGFNRVLVLQMLCAAAAYDADLAAEYDTRRGRWVSGIGWSLEVAGGWTESRGHWNKAANVSANDVQHFALAACALLLQDQRDPLAEEVRRGLVGWWRFMRHELNAVYTIVYAHFMEPDAEQRALIMAPILDELRDFPPVKRLAPPEDLLELLEDTPGHVQPIANRMITDNYWKANPYRRVTAHAPRHPKLHAAGMDYLLAYWMGRYFDVISAAPSGE